MSIPYKSPSFKGGSFNCPHCNAYAKQHWGVTKHEVYGHTQIIQTLWYCLCSHCGQYSLWHRENMLFPSSGTAPMPNIDMPENIKFDYEEARNIVAFSPRGAAALLRLCIQKLCAYLGEPGKDINIDIKNLVSKGLPVRVQQALDIVRVIGNEAVHPGQIDLTDDVETAITLFGLINFIIEDRITKPKEIELLYASLPPGKLAGIQSRDGKK